MAYIGNEKELKEEHLLKDFSVHIESKEGHIELETRGDVPSMLYGIIVTLFEVGNVYDLNVEKMVKKTAKKLKKKE